MDTDSSKQLAIFLDITDTEHQIRFTYATSILKIFKFSVGRVNPTLCHRKTIILLTNHHYSSTHFFALSFLVEQKFFTHDFWPRIPSSIVCSLAPSVAHRLTYVNCACGYPFLFCAFLVSDLGSFISILFLSFCLSFAFIFMSVFYFYLRFAPSVWICKKSDCCAMKDNLGRPKKSLYKIDEVVWGYLNWLKPIDTPLFHFWTLD